VGKSAVLEFNKNMFLTFDSINVNLKRIAVGQDCVIAEIVIVVNNHIAISVVDVIEFDQDNKIKSIRAYKQ